MGLGIQIMLYEFTRLKLNRSEFNNLVFMGEPPWWKEDKERHIFLSDICYKPLKKVAQEVIDQSGLKGPDRIPVKVFDSIDIVAKNEKGEIEKEPWFKRHARLSLCFNRNLMDSPWIRNLTKSCVDDRERKGAPNGTFYIEDGNHRALVYAVHLELGMAVYDPIDAIHATSWDMANGILGHSMQPMSVLEHNGKLQFNKCFKNGWTLPNGIQINWYKRNKRS